MVLSNFKRRSETLRERCDGPARADDVDATCISVGNVEESSLIDRYSAKILKSRSERRGISECVNFVNGSSSRKVHGVVVGGD